MRPRAVLVLFAVASATQAEPGPFPREIRTDADGVRLPDGAVARLGSARYRFDGLPLGAPAFSPDARRIAVASVGGVCVLDVGTGRQLHRFHLPDEQYAQVVRFLDDGKRLAVGSHGHNEGHLTVCELADGKPATDWKLPGKNQINVADITPDGSRVLYVDWFNKVCLWDVNTRQEIWSFPHTEPASVLKFTADGKHFAMFGYGQTELRDAQTGKLVAPFPTPGARFSNQHWVGMAPDGRLAIGAEKGDAVAVVAARGDDRVRFLPADRYSDRFAFSPDGRYLVGSGTQVWDLKEKDNRGPVARLPAASTAAFSPDGKTLALAGEGVLTLWSVGDWKRLPHGTEPTSPVRRVWFTPDGQRVLGYTQSGWLSWPAAGGAAARLSDDFGAYSEGLADVSADGRTAVDVVNVRGKGDDRGIFSLRVTDLATGKGHRIALDGQPWAPVQMSPDGRQVSVYLPNVGFFVWNAATGRFLSRHDWDKSTLLLGAVASADGKGPAFSLCGTWDRSNRGAFAGPSYSAVTVTDHATGRKWDLDPMPWTVYTGGGRFSRDGTRLILHGHFDDRWQVNSVSVWDVRAGRRLMNCELDRGYVNAIAPAADTRSLLIGYGKGDLVLVEVANGGERATFLHQGRVMSAAFGPGGTKAVSSSPDAPVYVWDLVGNPGAWEASKADHVWTDLVSSDAKVAFGAICKLRANPAAAVAFLRERVKLPAVPTDEAFTKLLNGLDANSFAERERSERELTAIADLVRPRLEAARKTASAEAGPRLDRVLKTTQRMTAEKLRQIRACEVLEGIGSADAMEVLRAWSRGPAGARLTEEAVESLARPRP